MLIQHVLSLAITAVTSIALFLYIAMSGRAKLTHKAYAVHIGCIGLWSGMQCIAVVINDYSIALIFWRLSHIPAIFIPIFLIHFTESTKPSSGIRSNLFVGMLYALGGVFALLELNGLIIQTISHKLYFRYYKDSGIGFNIFVAFWIVCAVYGLSSLTIRYLTSTDKERYQLKYFSYSMVFAYIGGVPNFLSAYGIRIPFLTTFGTYFIAIHVVTTTYVMMTRGLIDFQILVRKTFLYTILVLIVSLIYVATTFGIHILLNESLSQYPGPAISFVSLFTIACLIKPIEFNFYKYLDKLFFKGSIDVVHKQKEHLESELERTHRLKSVGILAAGMAHEIRNPIQSLRTFGEHLEKNYNDPEFRSKFEKLLIQETDRIKNLTSDLLDFSRPKEPKKVKTNLNELIYQTLSLLESDLMAEGVKVRKELPDKIIWKEVDPEQIKQALLNLFINAKDAMKSAKNKELHVSLEEIQSKARIAIQDTGCGISEQKIPHLFDPFLLKKPGEPDWVCQLLTL